VYFAFTISLDDVVNIIGLSKYCHNKLLKFLDIGVVVEFIKNVASSSW